MTTDWIDDEHDPIEIKEFVKPSIMNGRRH
jgi:hypothetical protein